MKLSIVTTLYNSSPYIQEFYQRIIAELSQITEDYELIFVNDGSSDDSLQVAKKVISENKRVKVIDLSRNFGHHKAMMTGLEASTGEYVFLIDVDLEEAPENLTKFWQIMANDSDIDVVYGELLKRQTPFGKRFLSQAFYKVFNFLSTIKIRDSELVSRLMTRAYVDALIAYKEREVFIPALWIDTGFRQVPYVTEKTYKGSTTYTLKKRFKMAIDAIASFSSRPLLLIFYSGLLISIISGGVSVYLVFKKVLSHNVIPGWASIMTSIYLLSGLMLLSLGIIGIYLSKIYIEVKKRPYSIIRAVYQEH